MRNAPLSLDLSYPTLIHVVSDPEGSCNAGYDVECDIQVAQSASNERRWRVQVGVTFSAKGVALAAHRGKVIYVGIFTVVDEFPLEKMHRLIGVDAPSILYSSIRELVALLTGRGSMKTVLLPTVSFIQNVVVPPPKTPDQNEGVRSAKTSKNARGVGEKESTSRGRRKIKLADTRQSRPKGSRAA